MPPENTGVIVRAPRPQDDMAGGLSRVVYEERVSDGQFDAYVPSDNETQQGVYGDTQSCTNNVCSNSIDTQINWMIANDKIPSAKLARLELSGFIVDGKCNTSERYNAIMSGTNGGQIPGQPFGNYLYKPWDSARKDGMIPESLLPYPNMQRTPVFTVNDYYTALITDAMKEAAQVWNEIFLTQYEIVPTDITSLQFHLKQAPLAIITGVCSPWAGEIIPACSKSSGHATELYGWSGSDYWKDFDSYLPNNKKLGWGYKIGYAIKGVVTLKDDLQVFKHFFNTPLEMGVTSDEVKFLQLALFLNGVWMDSQLNNREAIQKFGGYFGENTMRCVKSFQKKYGIQQVGKVGPLTLKQLNLLFS